MGRLLLLLFFLHLGLAFAAIVDCLGGEEKPVRLSRTLWTLIAIFGFLVGPITWFAYGRPGNKLQLPFGLPDPQRPGPRTVAPDDDPEFLRRLRQQPPADPPPADREPPATPPGEKPDGQVERDGHVGRDGRGDANGSPEDRNNGG